jgi:hypothetical protein
LHFISKILEQLSYTILILSDNKDDKTKKGSNNKRQGRIESKGLVTVIQVVIVMLIIIITASKIIRVKAYNLLSSACCLSLTILL